MLFSSMIVIQYVMFSSRPTLQISWAGFLKDVNNTIVAFRHLLFLATVFMKKLWLKGCIYSVERTKISKKSGV